MQLVGVKQLLRSTIGSRLEARHRVFENCDVHGPLFAPIRTAWSRNKVRC